MFNRKQTFNKPVFKVETVEELMKQKVVINGEACIKPYYYMRRNLLHVRYTVDRCVELSKDESIKLKVEMTSNPSDKQSVLAKAWSFFTSCVGKTVINDGIEASYDSIVRKKADNYGRFKN